eukprot:c8363_g1_i1.p1 GENE.c8363_g1_i1~~c8363_g1_i1.p1  ORF type:complete len:308 (+),score=119.67 c8363_g1_i1:39-962(+)
MNYLEEQNQEAESLEAILMQDFKKTDANSYEIIVLPDPDPAKNHISAVLWYRYTSTYPDAVPEMEVIRRKGFIADERWQELEDILRTEAEQNLGMPMMFTVVEAMRHWLSTRNFPQLSSHDEMMMRKKQDPASVSAAAAAQAAVQLQAQATAQSSQGKQTAPTPKSTTVSTATTSATTKDDPDFGGTLVTAESFMEWRGAFEAEMRAKVTPEQLAAAEEKRNRKSGRVFFEEMMQRGQALNEDTDDYDNLQPESDDDNDNNSQQQQRQPIRVVFKGENNSKDNNDIGGGGNHDGLLDVDESLFTDDV